MNNLVAIVGRPNVGKSTLFNRLSVRAKAIVHNFPGVTRDRKFAKAKLGPLKFNIVDTPGLESALEGSIQDEMRKQALKACSEAAVILFVVDYISGITTQDQVLANVIRKYAKHVVLIANKCEKSPEFDGAYYKLGFGVAIPISAEHGLGLMGICESLMELLIEEEENKIHDRDNIRITVIGRPNTGKSTYINALLKDDRLLVSDTAGTTRDSIEIDWQYQGHAIKIIDTAGLRRKAKIDEKLETFSAQDAISAINLSHVVILMIDAERYFEHQDFSILKLAAKEGRCIVVAVNKCDNVVEKNIEKTLSQELALHISEVPNIPVVYCSNFKNINIEKIIDVCIDVYGLWNKKISTSKLNAWIREAVTKHMPSLMPNGRRIKFKYITQINTRPLAFKIFTNTKDIPEDYRKYLINSLAQKFGLRGFEIRLFFAISDNPYKHKK